MFAGFVAFEDTLIPHLIKANEGQCVVFRLLKFILPLSGYNWRVSRLQGIILFLVGFLGLAGLGAAAWFILQPSLQEAQPPALAAPTLPVSASARPASTLTPTIGKTPAPGNALIPLPSNTPPAGPADCTLLLSTREEALVQDVLSGSVLRVDLGGNTAEVSLLGVDPAGSGAQAQALLREMAAGKAVTLLAGSVPQDGAGRLARYVLAGDLFVNYELIRRGAALPALFPPGQVCEETFLAAEGQARAEGAGYWSLAPTLAVAQIGSGTVAAACDCSKSYACSDFRTRAEAQSCYNACGDYRNTSLDPDHNGYACESLP